VNGSCMYIKKFLFTKITGNCGFTRVVCNRAFTVNANSNLFIAVTNNKHYVSRSHGFVLMEVLAAIAVIGVVMTPIIVLQGNMSRRVFSSSQQMQQIVFAQKFLVETQQKIQGMEAEPREYTVEQLAADNNTVLRYKLYPAKAGSLAEIPGLLIERVDIATKGRSESILSMVSIVYKPEQKET